THIPEELKELKAWCGFRFQQRGEKRTKIPINAYTGGQGKSNDESTWSDFETAVASIELLGMDDIGFFFKEPYIGIDIDDIGEDVRRYRAGDYENNVVSEFVDMLGSYAEVSP